MRLSVQDGSRAQFYPVEVKNTKDLLDIITKHTYSLGTFKDNYRKKVNFTGADYMGLDFDNSMTLKEAQLQFGKYEHIIATTKSHQKEKNGVVCDRFRVILKLDNFVDNTEDFEATVEKMMEMFPAADPKCKDSSRYFDKSLQVVSYKLEGDKIPVVKWRKPEIKSEGKEAYKKGNLSKATLNFLLFPPESQSTPGVVSNGALHKATIDLKEQSYSREEAIEMLQKATSKFGGLSDNCEKTVNGVYDRETKYPPRGGEMIFNFKRPGEMTEAAEQVDWLVEDLLGLGTVGLIVGAPKCGKSTLTRQLALSASRGEPWIERKVKKTNVLYLALEEHYPMFNKQMRHIGMSDEDNIFIHCGRPLPGDIKENLKQAIEHFNAGLVIIDTMLLLTTFTDINNYNEAYGQLNVYRELARETNSCILMVHHANKMGEGMNKIMGSVGLLGAVDCGIVVDTIRGDMKRRRVFSQGRGGVPFQDTTIEYLQEKDIYVKLANRRPEGI